MDWRCYDRHSLGTSHVSKAHTHTHTHTHGHCIHASLTFTYSRYIKVSTELRKQWKSLDASTRRVYKLQSKQDKRKNKSDAVTVSRCRMCRVAVYCSVECCGKHARQHQSLHALQCLPALPSPAFEPRFFVSVEPWTCTGKK